MGMMHPHGVSFDGGHLASPHGALPHGLHHGPHGAFSGHPAGHPAHPHGAFSGHPVHPFHPREGLTLSEKMSQLKVREGPAHKHADKLREELHDLERKPHRDAAARHNGIRQEELKHSGAYSKAVLTNDTKQVAGFWGCDQPKNEVAPVADLNYPLPPADPHHTFYKDFPEATRPTPARPIKPQQPMVAAQSHSLYEEPLYEELRLRLAQRDDFILKLGFFKRSVTLPSGEEVQYLEKPADRGYCGQQGALVLLHGIGMEGKDMLANLFGIPGQQLKLPPAARCLVPDGPGHGARRPHRHKKCLQDLHYEGYNPNAQMRDLDAFLTAVDVPPSEKIDIFAYSTSAAAALSLGYRRTAINKMVLLNPALAMAAARCTEVRGGRSLHDYDTLEEAANMLLVNGFSEASVRAAAPLVLVKRQAEMAPERYWSRICKAPTWDINQLTDFAVEDIQERQEMYEKAHGKTAKAHEDKKDEPKVNPVDLDPDDWASVAAAKEKNSSANNKNTSQAPKPHRAEPHPVIAAGILAAAGVKLLVLQGTKDRVVHPAVLEHLETPFKNQPGVFRVEMLEGFGHFGHPDQPKEMVLEPAYSVAADFFGYTTVLEQL